MSSLRVALVQRWLLAIVLLAIAGQPAMLRAQEFRGSISGRVTDTTDAALPGVTVSATNTATNVATTAITNGSGEYRLLYLTAGTYTLSADMSGFKKLTHSSIEVRVGDRLTIPFRLEIGAQTDVVDVVAEAPLLETASASAGQVIDERRIQLMPLADGNPFVLARLAPGVAYGSNLLFTRAFDNNAVSALRTNGGSGSSEFTLDGVPNTATGGEQDYGRVAFVPPAEAVSEFRVETASFDAAAGHTAGANVNVTIKNGTNRFSGSAYYFYRDEKLAEKDFFTEKAGGDKDPLSYNRFGATLGGPINRDKTFFFLSYEGLKDEFPEPAVVSVPTQAQRSGDFSNLLARGIQLYNPLSARLVNGQVVRDPFPGNIIPQSLISPSAAKTLRYYPLPNLPGDADGLNNYSSPNPRKDDYYSLTGRIDHTFSERNKIFLRYSRNSREETRNYFFPEVDGILPVGTGLNRGNNNASLDNVWTLNTSMVLNTRVGFSRFLDSNFRPHEGLDITSLGFTPQAVASFGGAEYFPVMDLNDPYQDLGNTLGSVTTSSIYTAQSVLTKVSGAHSFRVGGDFRLYRDDVTNPANQAGTYQFRGNFTSANQAAPAPRLGGDLVMLMMGIPTGGSIDRNLGRTNSVYYAGIFLQDDWRVSDKLTFNLGLRYDIETGMTEKDDRNTRGFDLTTPNPLEAQARAAYAANPVPQRPVSDFNVRGGYTFAGQGGRKVWNTDKDNIQPRVGFTFKLTEKTVVRGGVGIFAAPLGISAVNQVGSAQATSVPTTPDQGLTFPARIDQQPFPLGILEPTGSSLGLISNVGRATELVIPLDRQNARATRFLLGFQQELPGGVLFEANYVGNRGSDLEVTYDMNAIPRQYMSTQSLRDNAAIQFLETDTFPNPFFGNTQIPATEALRTTQRLSRGRLLRPYPHFQTLNTRSYDGTSTYNAAQFRLEKRFTHSFTILGTYAYSKFTEKTTKLNATDPGYEERPAFDSAPHRVTSSAIWELPFARNASGATKSFLGGWTVTGMFTYQTGQPINNLADRYYGGDPQGLTTDFDLGKYDPTTKTVRNVFPTDLFYLPDSGNAATRVNDQRIRRSTASQLRTFPTRIDSFRSPSRPLLDASVVKNFALSGRAKLQFRVEVFNLLNFVQLNNPGFDPTNTSFGVSTEQSNLPREIQLGAKVSF